MGHGQGNGAAIMGRIVRLIAVGFVLALAQAAVAAPAEASLRFCNHTSYVLRTAAALPAAPDGWRVEGWLPMRPGECRKVRAKLEAVPTFYIYAETHKAHRGAVGRWSGTRPFCVQEDDFVFEGPEACQDERRGRMFSRVAIETDAKEWTHRLREPDSTHMQLREARVAGVQRLLKDAGYFDGTIDGRDGPRTRKAIRNARKDLQFKATGIESPELIDSLIAHLEADQSKRGFRICNSTGQDAWAAVGFERGEQWVSRGWWMVSPRSCVKVVKDALPDRFVYVYAEALSPQGWQIRWEGEAPLCISEVKFEIEGNEGCATRGYEQALFERIDTEDRTGWELTLSDDGASTANGGSAR